MVEEIALKKQMLTEDQVVTLKKRQQGGTMSFGELAVSAGFLTPAQLDQVLARL